MELKNSKIKILNGMNVIILSWRILWTYLKKIELQAFVLNFNGRVEKPSVKNFQLIDEKNGNILQWTLWILIPSLDERIYLQFGRVTNDTFNMDLEWPLSPFQAFAICLSSFDYKIACE